MTMMMMMMSGLRSLGKTMALTMGMMMPTCVMKVRTEGMAMMKVRMRLEKIAPLMRGTLMRVTGARMMMCERV